MQIKTDKTLSGAWATIPIEHPKYFFYYSSSSDSGRFLTDRIALGFPTAGTYLP
jgi:hypothetical protein